MQPFPFWQSIKKKVFMHPFLPSNLAIIWWKTSFSCVSSWGTEVSTCPIKAQICSRCYDWCLFLGRRKTNTCFWTQTAELTRTGKVFHKSAKRVSLHGNQFVFTMVRLLWLQLILGWFMAHCWHFPCSRLLLVARNIELLCGQNSLDPRVFLPSRLINWKNYKGF